MGLGKPELITAFISGLPGKLNQKFNFPIEEVICLVFAIRMSVNAPSL